MTRAVFWWVLPRNLAVNFRIFLLFFAQPIAGQNNTTSEETPPVQPESPAFFCTDLVNNATILDQLDVCKGLDIQISPAGTVLNLSTINETQFERFFYNHNEQNNPIRTINGFTVYMANSALKKLEFQFASGELTLLNNKNLFHLTMRYKNKNSVVKVNIRGNKHLREKYLEELEENRGKLIEDTSLIQQFGECDFASKSLGSLSELNDCRYVVGDLIIDNTTQLEGYNISKGFHSISGCLKVRETEIANELFEPLMDQVETITCPKGKKNEIKSNPKLCLRSTQKHNYKTRFGSVSIKGNSKNCSDICTPELVEKAGKLYACPIIEGSIILHEKASLNDLEKWDKVVELNGAIRIDSTRFVNVKAFKSLKVIRAPNNTNALTVVKNQQLTAFSMPKLKTIEMPLGSVGYAVVFSNNGLLKLSKDEKAAWNTIAKNRTRISEHREISQGKSQSDTADQTMANGHSLESETKLQNTKIGVFVFTGICVALSLACVFYFARRDMAFNKRQKEADKVLKYEKTNAEFSKTLSALLKMPDNKEASLPGPGENLIVEGIYDGKAEKKPNQPMIVNDELMWLNLMHKYSAYPTFYSSREELFNLSEETLFRHADVTVTINEAPDGKPAVFVKKMTMELINEAMEKAAKSCKYKLSEEMKSPFRFEIQPPIRFVYNPKMIKAAPVERPPFLLPAVKKLMVEDEDAKKNKEKLMEKVCQQAEYQEAILELHNADRNSKLWEIKRANDQFVPDLEKLLVLLLNNPEPFFFTKPTYTIKTCEMLCEALAARKPELKQNNVTLERPAMVIGDSFGSLHDLLAILNLDPQGIARRDGYHPIGIKRVFLGNYFDIGVGAIDCFILIVLLAFKFPDRYFALRGQHEGIVSTEPDSLYQMLEDRWGRICALAVTLAIRCVTCHLPYSATIDGTILCCNSGPTADQLQIQAKNLDEVKADKNTKTIFKNEKLIVMPTLTENILKFVEDLKYLDFSSYVHYLANLEVYLHLLDKKKDVSKFKSNLVEDHKKNEAFYKSRLAVCGGDSEYTALEMAQKVERLAIRLKEMSSQKMDSTLNSTLFVDGPVKFLPSAEPAGSFTEPELQKIFDATNLEVLIRSNEEVGFGIHGDHLAFNVFLNTSTTLSSRYAVKHMLIDGAENKDVPNDIQKYKAAGSLLIPEDGRLTFVLLQLDLEKDELGEEEPPAKAKPIVPTCKELRNACATSIPKLDSE